MDIQDAFKAVESFQGNVSAGIVVALYYLIVYWPKIKDGLGLSRGRKYDLNKVEKNYQLLKLRIEIEEIKKKSNLDSDLLERLESEMQARLEGEKGKPFSSAQKFIAIPLIILVALLTAVELQEAGQAGTDSSIDILSGAIFIITITIIGFWGIPVLQSFKRGWLRKTGFICFWSFAFYIICYFSAYIAATTFWDYEELPDPVISLIFLASISCCLLLGLLGKLPLMNSVPTMAAPLQQGQLPADRTEPKE